MPAIQDTDQVPMGSKEVVLAIATDGSGDDSVETPPLTGRLLGVQIDCPLLDSGADWTIASDKQGNLLTVANKNDVYLRPRQPVHAQADGSAISGLAEPATLNGETLTVAVANGGASKTGTVRLHLVRGL